MSKRHKKKDHRAALSPREREVLTWAAHGKTYAEIASLLAIGEKTVKTHVNNVGIKLGTRNKTHTVALAISLGLIRLSSKEIPESRMLFEEVLCGNNQEPS